MKIQIVKQFPLPLFRELTKGMLLDVNHYYGLLDKRGGGEKAFIVRDVYNKGTFRVRCRKELTNGNNYEFGGETIEEVLWEIIEFKNTTSFKVYEFDNAKEFFAWMAE